MRAMPLCAITRVSMCWFHCLTSTCPCQMQSGTLPMRNLLFRCDPQRFPYGGPAGRRRRNSPHGHPFADRGERLLWGPKGLHNRGACRPGRNPLTTGCFVVCCVFCNSPHGQPFADRGERPLWGPWGLHNRGACRPGRHPLTTGWLTAGCFVVCVLSPDVLLDLCEDHCGVAT